MVNVLITFCSGKGRGRKRKGSGSEEDYSPMKKTAKPAGRVSISLRLLDAVLHNIEAAAVNISEEKTPSASCTPCSLWPDVIFYILHLH